MYYRPENYTPTSVFLVQGILMWIVLLMGVSVGKVLFCYHRLLFLRKGNYLDPNDQ